jgi:hypothetical protein
MRKELALISSKEASNRLNVPELALGQLAMDRKWVSLNISAIWLVANENHLHLSINTDNSFLCTIMRCNIIDHNFAKSDFKCVA